MSDALAIIASGGAVRFAVRVVPRANQSAIDGRYGTALKVRLAAPPVDGAANDELVRFLAEELGVRRSAIRIVSGLTSRSKRVEVAGMSEEAVRLRIEEQGSRSE